MNLDLPKNLEQVVTPTLPVTKHISVKLNDTDVF